VESIEAARAIARRECQRGPLVLKPLFGAQGQGIRLIHRPDDLPDGKEVADVFYLQRYVSRAGSPFRDFRVFVCGGRAIAMMSRRNDDWITNVNRGGKPGPAAPEARKRPVSLGDCSGRSRRREFCRGRYPLRRRQEGFCAGGEQHARLVGPAIGDNVNIADELAGAFLDHIAETHAAEPRRPILHRAANS
jgi:hypothetical protein